MSFPAFLLSWLLFLAAALALFSIFLGRRVEAALPARGKWLEVGDHRLHYRELGAGPPIVLVHGLGGQMRNFDYLPLQELATRFRLVLIDRPGCGHSPRGDDAHAGIEAQARIVAGFIRAMRFGQAPLLAGHSLGGAIALGVAVHEPEVLAGLALIAPLTHAVAEVPQPLRPLAIRNPWLRRLFAYTLAVPLSIVNGRKAMEFVFAPEPVPRDFPLRGGGLLGLRPKVFYASSTELCAVEHELPAQQERYRELRLPVHVLCGDGDRVLDGQVQGQALADRLPQAKLEVVAGAGHMLPVTQPRRTADFLQRAAVSVLCNSAAIATNTAR